MRDPHACAGDAASGLCWGDVNGQGVLVNMFSLAAANILSVVFRVRLPRHIRQTHMDVMHNRILTLYDVPREGGAHACVNAKTECGADARMWRVIGGAHACAGVPGGGHDAADGRVL